MSQNDVRDELSRAIVSGDLAYVQAYVDNGGDFDGLKLVAPDGYGALPIELAAKAQVHHEGSAEVTRLVQAHSSVEVQAEALVGFASKDASLAEARALLESGVGVDVLHDKVTALQRATGNGNLKMVHLLLSHGADPNKPGEYGTALEGAEEQHYEPAYQGMMESFLKGEPKSPYDFVDKEALKEQLTVWAVCLDLFAKEHPDQTFYVLAVDAGELKANSQERFEATLKKYRENFPDSYEEAEDVERLRFSPGDFSFHEIEQEVGDAGLLEAKAAELDFSFLEPREDENRTRKNLLGDGLVMNLDVLTRMLKRTEDFRIIAPGHVY